MKWCVMAISRASNAVSADGPTRHAWRHRALILLCIGLCGAWFGPGNVRAQEASPRGVAATPLSERLALGQRIYREGVRSSGEPLVATSAAQTRLSGKDAACAACHKRSGFGASEGRFVIRPITGPALLQEQTVPVYAPRIKARIGVGQRPPYSEALLARAIRTGTDAAGKPLDPLMPRYELSDTEMEALSAYLFTLSSRAPAGVDEQEIHFAVVIQPGVPPERRRIMLDVMQAFVKDKGANIRADEQRREAGTMRMYRAYRKWVLHVWDLTGPSEGWGAQLEALYRQQPVFALIGGMGTASWRPIHDFSEHLEIPTLFPQVDLPVVSGDNQYTVYFSKGLTLEAEVLAKFLRDEGVQGPVVQVHRRDEPGTTAAAAFRTALAKGGGGPALEDRIVDSAPGEAFWRSLSAAKPAAVVVWLAAQDLAVAPTQAGVESFPVYLSSSLLGGKPVGSAAMQTWNARVIVLSDLPPMHDTRLLRTRHWLHNKGIPLVDETVQVNTEYAMTIASDVIGHMADSFSRDLFIERVEHVVGQTPSASTYPQVSLGPGQRFAAKGGAIVQPQDADQAKPKMLSTWIVP
jgi:hypothetical protein